MSVIKSNFLLLITAAIWGFAFVAQRVGMDYVGPFTYNGVRFLLGSLSLVPLVFYFRGDAQNLRREFKSAIVPGIIAGSVLFSGVSLQQVGIMYTTAGKAAFITGLYVVLVPIISILLGRKIGRSTWLGCFLAVNGLYLLCIKETMILNFGDMLELIGAFFWAVHILIIGYFSRRVDALKLSCIQFFVCSVLSLAVALVTETIVWADILAAYIVILYGGICSTGVAYTLQVVAQKSAPSAHAAIILSMETVFAAIGGFLILEERMSGTEIFGCALMLFGMLAAQIGSLGKKGRDETASIQSSPGA
ncbi:MAG: DMT family transporter [Bacillota bacterium]